MKKIYFLLIILTFIISSCSSNSEKIIIDPLCEERALAVVPQTIILSFEKAFNGYDDNELHYVSNSITWADKHNNIINRAFRKPTIVGLDKKYYYPLDKDTELDSSWGHTEDITYLKDEPVFAKYTFEFTLEGTDSFVFNTKQNQLSGFPQEDTTSGKRVFKVIESKVIFCDDDK